MDIHKITAIPTQIELFCIACTIDLYQKPGMKEIDLKCIFQDHSNKVPAGIKLAISR